MQKPDRRRKVTAWYIMERFRITGVHKIDRLQKVFFFFFFFFWGGGGALKLGSAYSSVVHERNFHFNAAPRQCFAMRVSMNRRIDFNSFCAILKLFPSMEVLV